MDHNGTTTIWIKEKNIILRRFVEEDAPAMFDHWAHDPEVTKYLTWSAYEEITGVSEKIAEWVDHYQFPDFYLWAIEYRNDLIGTISAKVEEPFSTDRAELGYCIGKHWWNSGIMTEAAKAVIDYMFNECKTHSCGIEHCADNPASGRVAKKCGMHKDGVRPEYFRTHDGTWQDVTLWSITKREWEYGR